MMRFIAYSMLGRVGQHGVNRWKLEMANNQAATDGSLVGIWTR
jgi:hypothetical protein